MHSARGRLHVVQSVVLEPAPNLGDEGEEWGEGIYIVHFQCTLYTFNVHCALSMYTVHKYNNVVYLIEGKFLFTSTRWKYEGI